MTSINKALPPTKTKVNENTPEHVNREIQKEIEEKVQFYQNKDSITIAKRLNELEHEWDTERVLETNMATIALVSSLMGLSGKKNWMVLSATVSAFMIQHAIQGWCPPLSVIRRMGVRTAAEIDQERVALQKLLEHQGD